jgi:hypothetical protein
MKDGEINMAYTRGTNTNIIVGAAALFVTNDQATLASSSIPGFIGGESFRETLSLRYSDTFRNVGYTNNGLEIAFAPDFGEVMVDQLLDTAKIFKQGMKVTLKTTLAEATLENLLLAIAGKKTDFGVANLGTVAETNYLASLGATPAAVGSTAATTAGVTTAVPSGTGNATVTDTYLNLTSGDLGDYPIERGLIAIGPGIGGKDGSDVNSPNLSDQAERVYIAYRAVSIDSVTVSAKRDSATSFEVSFRLLPDNNGAYGKIVDRTY